MTKGTTVRTVDWVRQLERMAKGQPPKGMSPEGVASTALVFVRAYMAEAAKRDAVAELERLYKL